MRIVRAFWQGFWSAWMECAPERFQARVTHVHVTLPDVTDDETEELEELSRLAVTQLLRPRVMKH